MGNYNDFFNELIEQDADLAKEIKLLDLKYLLIEELLKFRKENKLSQTDFANLIGVKQQMISRFEKGEVDPRLSFVSKIIYGMKKEIQISDKNFIKSNHKLEIVKLKNKILPLKKMNYLEFDKVI